MSKSGIASLCHFKIFEMTEYLTSKFIIQRSIFDIQTRRIQGFPRQCPV